jgi:hypothetical protein
VAAVLILIATTPWPKLSVQLRCFHVPPILVTLLEMSYRYIAVLLGEVQSMYTAYKLRSCGMKGIAMAHMGSFVGRLFLRSADRADRVYAAMKCRGYNPVSSRTLLSEGEELWSSEGSALPVSSAELRSSEGSALPDESGLHGERFFSYKSNSRPFSLENILFFVLVSLSCVLFRLFDLPALVGLVISRVLSL